MKQSVSLSSSLILKGAIHETYIRVFRVYNGHYVYYEEEPNEGGISREAKVFDKIQMEQLLSVMVDNGDLSLEDKINFLKDGE